MSKKVAKEIFDGVAEQKRKAKNLDEKNQGNYIDSSRNTAVNLDSKELKKTLGKIKSDDDGVLDNTGIVNSDQYQREAGHYLNHGMFVQSANNLAIGDHYFQMRKYLNLPTYLFMTLSWFVQGVQ